MRNGFDPVLKYNYDIYFKYNNYTPSMNCKKLVMKQPNVIFNIMDFIVFISICVIAWFSLKYLCLKYYNVVILDKKIYSKR